MKLSLRIALRYLFAKKSHNVINIISAISVGGMAIGVAALVIILSIFNGFESLVSGAISNVEPNILIVPKKGKIINIQQDSLNFLYANPKIVSISRIVQENVYIGYDGHNSIAKAKGVDTNYINISPLKNHIVNGKFSLYNGDIPECIVGNILAYNLNINPNFNYPLELFYPTKNANISMSNPLSSVNSVEVYPSGVFRVNAQPDKELIILPIAKMQELLGYNNYEFTSIEVRTLSTITTKEQKELISVIKTQLGHSFIVYNRVEQNPSLYKMLRYEKMSVYLIMLFIIIIVGFNIFGSISMLIIEKENDIEIMRSFGATSIMIKRIFILEGWLIGAMGWGLGLSIGILFCLLQQTLGIIKMPTSFISEPYPIVIQPTDIFICSFIILCISYIIAFLPVKKYIKV